MTVAPSHEDRGLFDGDLDGPHEYDTVAFSPSSDEVVVYSTPLPALAPFVNDDYVVPAGMPKEV